MGVPKARDHKQINIQIPDPSQAPPASSEAPNQDLKDMDVLCTFKIKIESQNLEYVCTKDQWPYPNQYQDAKPHSRTSSVLQSPKWGLKGHGCSLHLQNQDRESKLGSLVYQRPVIISKSRSRCQTPVRNIQHLKTSNPDLKDDIFVSGVCGLFDPIVQPNFLGTDQLSSENMKSLGGFRRVRDQLRLRISLRLIKEDQGSQVAPQVAKYHQTIPKYPLTKIMRVLTRYNRNS